MQFDLKSPDYDIVFRERLKRLRRIRANPAALHEITREQMCQRLKSAIIQY